MEWIMVAAFASDKAGGPSKRSGTDVMAVVDRIRQKLTEAFHPDRLEVVDESHLHKGHPGHRPEGETHYRIRITAGAFGGVSRIAAHRMIYDALNDEIAGGVHALMIEARGPQVRA
jgi:BolA protein